MLDRHLVINAENADIQRLMAINSERMERCYERLSACSAGWQTIENVTFFRSRAAYHFSPPPWKIITPHHTPLRICFYLRMPYLVMYTGNCATYSL